LVSLVFNTHLDFFHSPNSMGDEIRSNQSKLVASRVRNCRFVGRVLGPNSPSAFGLAVPWLNPRMDLNSDRKFIATRPEEDGSGLYLGEDQTMMLSLNTAVPTSGVTRVSVRPSGQAVWDRSVAAPIAPSMISS
jgi:hypothetical protein